MSEAEVTATLRAAGLFRTHLAGFVCLGVEHAVAEPQARLLTDLLEVRSHGFWKRVTAPLLQHSHKLSFITVIQTGPGRDPASVVDF